ncbi:transaldolase/glucose-6-phosphate isomerase [Rhizomicrobium palustre]|uniref:Transaldolase n=1 Tax=Rhizomicrobium palustre TaxID=189966 RepID=A0A846N216_9PROT|nr:bifunctional transaldolase/phosoglucose isomerase [Rhizomicrobium palustre]NIK89262.1 transaldolase/glucose-6-phosphate isomerase [Rhizomicrobium palustre]
MNPLKELEKFGQAPWLDNLGRGLVRSGDLARLVQEEGIKGVTSNPAIFEKSMGHTNEYDDEIRSLLDAGKAEIGLIFNSLAITDIKAACDVLRPVYDATKKADGFVSMECNPYLALDTEATLVEARHLWKEIGRENAMIKVPATHEGIPAIQTLLSEGININVTLLFSQEMYKKVALAYIAGLEGLPKDYDLSTVSSVASFFVSRIDAKIDALLAKKAAEATGDEKARIEALAGKTAIANAKLAYVAYEEIFSGPRWEALAKRGARPQRLLWASTGVKSKAYPDTLYVDTLIGDNTVNTMPPATVEAFRDHGKPAADTIKADVEGAHAVLAALPGLGIDLDAITTKLVEEGVELFAVAADNLFGAIAGKCDEITGKKLRISWSLAGNEEAVTAAQKAWTKAGNIRKVWAKDTTIWARADEDKWLGWLDAPTKAKGHQASLEAFQAKVKAGSWSDVVLLGMGGSSLGAEVLREVLVPGTKFHILDSTDPDEVQTLDKNIAIATTLFIVASKSGSTLEPNLFKDYYFDRVAQAVGKNKAASHFVAITDPGSSLEKDATAEGFSAIFPGEKSIGGRYSVLSNFGLVAAAAMGVNIDAFIKEALAAEAACGPLSPPPTNPGAQIGIALGTLALRGRDKLTVLASKGLSSFGAWLEQLVAESTGKLGKGIIPFDGEPVGSASAYGEDRVFVVLKLKGEEAHDNLVGALKPLGHPVIEVEVDGPYQLARLFYIFEIATAVAGSFLGINPFDQPDVEAAKVKARALMEAGGAKDSEKPVFARNGISVYADPANAKALAGAETLEDCLAAHFKRVGAGDYIALVAFIERNAAHTADFDAMRAALRDKTGAAVGLGFGPRFLHSTGQGYKGGPASGVFLQVTCKHVHDVAVPGRGYTFGAVIDAQAAGDLAVLTERGRRAIRVHLDTVDEGLKTLARAVEAALK